MGVHMSRGNLPFSAGLTKLNIRAWLFVYNRGMARDATLEHNTQAMSLPGYETAAQAAERLGISSVQLRKLCNQGRVPGAQYVADRWFIPQGVMPIAKSFGRPPKWGKRGD